MATCVFLGGEKLASFLPQGVTRQFPWSGGVDWQLCAMSPTVAPHLMHRSLRCDTLLVPEGAYCPLWQARQVVSCGLSRRSSLTLSSMGERSMLCLQRTLVDRWGRRLESQELPLPAPWLVFPPVEQLLLAGFWLLWGQA